MAIVDGKIRCSRCETFKNADASGFQPYAIKRGSGTCKPCKHDQKREHYQRYRKREAAKQLVKRNANVVEFRRKANDWRRRNPEKVKGHNLKNTYGITLSEYKAMLDFQFHSCACCGKKKPDETLFVDHCHNTGLIRGLLCKKCNSGIGHLGDDLDGVLKAANYLRGTI